MPYEAEADCENCGASGAWDFMGDILCVTCSCDADGAESPEHDPVNRPSHYAEGRRYEPLDVIRDWRLDYPTGNVVKYISRAGRKGDELEDLRKAAFYLARRIRELEEK